MANRFHPFPGNHVLQYLCGFSRPCRSLQTTARYPQVGNATGFYLTRNDITNFTAPFKAFNLSDPQYAKDLEQVGGVVRAQLGVSGCGLPGAETCLGREGSL